MLLCLFCWQPVQRSQVQLFCNELSTYNCIISEQNHKVWVFILEIISKETLWDENQIDLLIFFVSSRCPYSILFLLIHRQNWKSEKLFSRDTVYNEINTSEGDSMNVRPLNMNINLGFTSVDNHMSHHIRKHTFGHVHPRTYAPTEMFTHIHVHPQTCAPTDVHPQTCAPTDMCTHRHVYLPDCMNVQTDLNLC